MTLDLIFFRTLEYLDKNFCSDQSLYTNKTCPTVLPVMEATSIPMP